MRKELVPLYVEGLQKMVFISSFRIGKVERRKSMLNVNFDSTMHLHLGYYENHYDIEAVAYKIVNKDVWYVFIEKEEAEKIKGVIKHFPFYEHYGYHIFTVEISDLTFEHGSEKLTKWLKVNNII